MRSSSRSQPALPDPALWERVAGYDFDHDPEPGARPPERGFAERLAALCRWRRSTAEAAIAEYRRFAYLAVLVPHRAVPSVAVDLVWHAHLADTRGYWERFCGDVLGRPLHHRPSGGGRAEAARLKADYARTLTSYRRVFGEDPPLRFWPHPEGRFAAGSEPRLFAPHGERAMPRRLIAAPAMMSAGSLLFAGGIGAGWSLPLGFGAFLMLVGGAMTLGALLGLGGAQAFAVEVGVGSDASDGGDGGDGDGGGCGGD
ncbi:hypothetical protein LNKW23_39100 [Paralimibaculum aggregatum]|uniref:TIGR04222 domain-containing membrane protein n=1 Tax=Paralimibaculum aggregatum TaxID=3036245 RepID=A0ABQ6LNA2_9RHOB|nr:hypothetical protein [Limibaculum sp. NKW23]GMG84694.1 hypothetical protein LNKW23_39100 [Limibaculum sp. NKW23]